MQLYSATEELSSKPKIENIQYVLVQTFKRIHLYCTVALLFSL